ncbi:MAG TPA: GAF domain-containing protein, partial [Chloroflexota bacterium]
MSRRGVSAGNVLPIIRRTGEVQPPLDGKRRLRVHTVVEETTAAIAAATDLDMALRALLVGMHRLTGADIGGVRLPPDSDHLIGPCRIFYFGGMHDGTWRSQETLPASDVARVYTSGSGVYSPDLQAEARAGDEAASRALVFRDIGSSLIVPLRAGGRVIGSLHADARQPHAFRTAQLRPLQVLADHAGGAVDQARWREEASVRLQRLLVVERVSAAVNDAGDLDDLLQRVLAAAADLVDTQRAQIALVDPDRKLIRGRVGRDLPPGMLEATVRPLFPDPDPAEDIFALVVRTGEQVVTDDTHPALHGPTKARFGLTGLHRVFTPIAHGGETIGVLAIIWRCPPTSADCAILRLVAEQAGGAIARARLVEAERAQFQARLQAEAVSRESESRFRQAFQYTAAGMALVGLDGRYLQVNAALCRMLGYGAAELLDTTFSAITHPDDRAAGANLVGQLMRRDVDYFVQEKRYIRRDNAVVWVVMSLSLVRDGDGQPSYFVSQV